MIVSSSIFNLIYLAVREKFYREDYLPTKKKATIESPDIWDFQNPDQRQCKASELFAGKRPDSCRHIYRKWNELNQRDEGHVDHVVILKMLTYIGIAPLNDVLDWKKQEQTKQAQILLKQFVLQNKHQLPPKDVAPFIDGLPKDIEPIDETLSSNLTEAKLVVQKFYESLAIKNCKAAWNLLSQEMQSKKPWEGEYEKFEIGYKNTCGIRNIIVFNMVSSVANVIDCRVFYDDEVSVYHTLESATFPELTVGDVMHFAELVKKMKDRFEAKGLENFDHIELGKLFEPAASEYIWYKCGYDRNKLDELFGKSPKSIIVKRVYDCSCHLTSQGWRINTINAMKTYSAR